MDKGCKQIHCFEPEPENFKQLVDNLKDYKYFQPYNFAVSNKSGKRMLNIIPGKNTGLHSFFGEGSKTVEVNTVSLDDILNRVEKVSLLKIDTEGAECEILFESKLLSKVDTIVGEYHFNHKDETLKKIVRFLESKNFKIEKIKEHNSDSGIFIAKNNTK